MANVTDAGKCQWVGPWSSTRCSKEGNFVPVNDSYPVVCDLHRAWYSTKGWRKA